MTDPQTCYECQQPMKTFHVGGMDVLSLFSPQPAYCENEACKRVGLLSAIVHKSEVKPDATL